MKQLNRVFALLLAACMLLTSLGVSAWADGAALPPDAAPAVPPAEEQGEDGGETDGPVLTLPASLKTIETEAFCGDSSLGEVVLPEGLQSIGERAFAQSSLAKINLPASLGANAIADSAFDGVEDLTVTATPGTAAYDWAVGKGLIEQRVAVDETRFPDRAFRSYVANVIDSDGDGELSGEEIAAVKSISLSGSGVQSFTGLALFTELEYLECSSAGGWSDTPLSSLDVSGNKKLKTLICQSNALTELDVSQNTALERLICIGNRLSSLDVSHNPLLVELRCGANADLTALDLSENTALQKLYCRECDLSELTLTNNPALKVLFCDGNPALGALSVSANPLLEELSCVGCGLTALDVSNNGQLIQLDCSNNKIGSLNLSNNTKLRSLHCEGCGLSELDVSYNTDLSSLRCENNALSELTLNDMDALTELHCANTDIESLDISSCETLLIACRLGTEEVEDSVREYFYGGGHTAKGYIRLRIPESAELTAGELDGGDGVEISTMSFPDPVLRAYVFDNFDTDQDYYLSDDECVEVTEIRLAYRGVADLSGIAFFPNLRVLDCEHGFDNDGLLTAVDLSHNTELEVLNLTGNPGLMALDVTMLPKLRELCVGYTGMSTLNVTENALLEKLLVNNCSFMSLNLSKNEQLKELDCCFNEGLTALDITGNPELVKLYRLGGRTPDWCPPFIAASLIGYTGGDGQLVLNRDVTVTAGDDACLASLTVDGIRRYETERVDNIYEQRNYNGEIVARIPYRWVNCEPENVTLTMSDGKSFSGGLWDAVDWLRQSYDLEAEAWWGSDETPYYIWDSGVHTAYAALGGLRAQYEVEVLANPVASVTVSGNLSLYEFSRQREFGYESENGWVEYQWERLDCWPGSDEGVFVRIELNDGSVLEGTADSVRSEMYDAGYGNLMGWHSSESPENLWVSGESYTAWLDVGEESVPFDVMVLADPVESLTVDPQRSSIERYSMAVEERWGYESEDGSWVDGPWMAISAWPGDDESLFITAVLDGKTYSGTANQVIEQMEAAGWSNQLRLTWTGDETPDKPWTAGGTYTATLMMGGKSVDYSVKVLENPIRKLTVNGDLTRYLGGRTERVTGYEDYNDKTGRFIRIEFDEVYDRLDANPANLPMSVVTNEWVEDDSEEGGHYLVLEGENLEDLRFRIRDRYGVDLMCHWESAESPNDPWDHVGDYTAWQILGPFVARYTVHVLEYPISGVELETVKRYSYDTCEGWSYQDEDGIWHDDSYTRIDCWPRSAEITVSFTDSEEEPLSGSFDELEPELRERFGELYWESDDTPLNPWGPGPHTARLVIGGIAWDYEVEVLDDPVQAVSIQFPSEGIERYVFDRHEIHGYDSPDGWIEQRWWRIDAWPGMDPSVTVSVTMRDGESFTGTADEVQIALEEAGYRDMIGWHSEETPQELWQGGNSYTAWLDVGGMSASYQVKVLENPITELWVGKAYHTLGVAEAYNPDQGWVLPVEDEYIDCTPDLIHIAAVKDGKTIECEGDEGRIHEWLREELQTDFEMHCSFIDPPEEWQTNVPYQAVLVLGPENGSHMTANYSVMLVENPIKRIRIDEQRIPWDQRYESQSYRIPGDGPFGGFWVPSGEPWQQLDVTPTITVTLADGTTRTDNAHTLFEELNGEVMGEALRYYLITDETPENPWYGGQHGAYFVIGSVGYYFDFTVEGPIESVTVPAVTRHANHLSDWTAYYDFTTDSWHEDEEKPWRIEAHPDSITITLAEGYTFSNNERSMTFENTEERGCLGIAQDELEMMLETPFTLHWNSNETPSTRWQPGEDGDAWVEIPQLCEDGIFHYTVHVTDEAPRVALLADGPVNDAAFNQAGFDAAKDYCEEYGVDFDCFILEDGQEPTALCQFALDLGSNVIVAVGDGFASAVASLAPDYPDARFILVDSEPTDEEHEQIAENAVGLTYREEQAGYMAGYAAVKLGYHKLGFLGGMEVPGVVRYGIGFVQGAQAAATELGIDDLSINYAYSGTFRSEDWITEAMNNWYADGTQAVFACGGGVWESVAQAAANYGGKIIGVDVDQAADIDREYGAGLTLTSAMKGIGPSVKAELNAVLHDEFTGGVALNLGVTETDAGLNGAQLAPSTQFGEGFTEEDYAALVESIANANPVSDDISSSPLVFSPHVMLCDIYPAED